MRISVVLDCTDPEALAAFWGTALEQVRAWTGEDFVVFASETDPKQPVFILQKVPEPRQGKNRMHIDLHPPDVETKRKELEAAGATFVQRVQLEELNVWWDVMRDPAGNEFCLVQDPPR